MARNLLKKIFDNFLEMIALVAFIGLIFLTLFQVLSRYIFTVPIAFSEEVGRFLFIWISFLGAAVVMKKNAHIRLDLLQGKINSRLYSFLQLFAFLATGLFSFLMMTEGLRLLDVASRQTAPVSRLSMGLVYFVMPASAFFMLVFSCVHFLGVLIELRRSRR